ncbi:MAG: hypothetical protein ACK4MW_05780 [Aquificaceae bacterium]
MRKILFLLPFLVSMSEPIKDSNIEVTVEDKSGIRHNLKGLVCNGREYLRVREGSIDYSINFSSIERIEVLSQEGKDIKLRIYTNDGGSKEYLVSANTHCKSKTPTGHAGFYIKDVKNIFIKTEGKK